MARRYKRATAPLGEAARARLWREGSSGESAESSYSASDPAELADLVDSFYHEEEIERGKGKDDIVASEKSGPPTGTLEAVLAESEADSAARRIRVEAERAIRVVGPGGDGFKRRVVGWLRDRGLDAGLCKSSWESAAGIPAGKHEYIAVIDRGGGTRYILELNFAAEFEIARPTKDYSELLRSLPSVFVGGPDALESIVALMCAAMKESLRSSGMHLPPWRREEYVRVKWFSSCERNSTASALKSGAVKQQKFCRIDLRRREMQVRKGMLAVEFRGMSKGYGF